MIPTTINKANCYRNEPFLLQQDCSNEKLIVYLQPHCNKMDKVQLYIKENLDMFGIAGSTLCAIHCSALPLLLATGSLSGLAWMESHWVEYLFLGSAVLLAGWSIYGSYSKHQRPAALIMAILGFILFFIGMVQHNHSEIGLTTLGGVIIALAHFVNWRILRQSGTSHATA